MDLKVVPESLLLPFRGAAGGGPHCTAVMECNYVKDGSII